MVVVTINNGPPTEDLAFGFSAHLSTMIHGKTQTMKNQDGSTTVKWDKKPSQAFYEDLEESGWFMPDMESVHLKAKMYRRQTLEENQAYVTPMKNGTGSIPVNAFVFICRNDVAGEAFNANVGSLIKCCIRACERHDGLMASTRPTWRGNTYSEYQEEADLLFNGEIVPMDQVLLNGNVCDFLIACSGNKDEKISHKNLLLYKKLDEQDKEIFSDVTKKGYCYDAIAFCGYPVCEDTGTVTIKARLSNSITVLKGGDMDDDGQPIPLQDDIKCEILQSIGQDVVFHIVNNIDEACIALLGKIVELCENAADAKLKKATLSLQDDIYRMKGKLDKTKKRSASDTQTNQGGPTKKGGRSKSRNVTNT